MQVADVIGGVVNDLHDKVIGFTEFGMVINHKVGVRGYGGVQFKNIIHQDGGLEHGG